jgi:hypothetical protein
VEVLEVLYDRLKEAVTQDQALGDLVLRAFILRRNIHADVGAGLRIIGSRYSADARVLREFASRNRIPCRWEDVEEDPDAEVTLRAFDIPPDQTPVVIWKGRTVLRNPSTTELAELLGLYAGRRLSRGGASGGGRPDRTRRARRHGCALPTSRPPGDGASRGASVYYAATEFEARLCGQDPVTVVGGGNSAGQAACFLSRRSPVVNLVIRHDDLRRDMSRYLADRVEQSPRIEIWRHSEVCELIGDEGLEEVMLHDLQTEEKQRVATTALFVLIGAAPHTSWLQGELPLDAKGYVLTGAADRGDGLFETRRQGAFAVGDVRSGSVKRVASAVGEGSVAIRQVHEFLEAQGRR